MARILLSLSVYLLSSITVVTAATSTVTTGFIPFDHEGSQYQTWYSAYTPSERTEFRPLIAVHGGPGFTHDYLDAIQDLASSRPVIFYDQIGNGNSTHFVYAQAGNDTRWSVDLYLNELKNVIDFFGFDSIDILGHSWGGILGAEYAVLGPEKLHKLVLSNSLAEMDLWEKSQTQLLSAFPQDVQEGIAAGFSDRVRYRAALEIFYGSHGCTVHPWPAQLNASFDAFFADPTVATKMAPVLSKWTIVDRLKNIKVPTLVINGAHDIAQDFVIQPFMDNIPNVTHFKFENSSHTPMWEERDRYMSVVADFLA